MTTVTYPDARTLLARHGLHAKKRFGQNFLVSERVFEAIVDATVVAPEDWVVEIGAGLGTLTARLAARVPNGKVIALEHDRDLVAVLRHELAALTNVEVVEVDALRYDVRTVAARRGRPIIVCGNLPYHIAAPLLFSTLDARPHVERMIAMVQREMADRILAAPGTAAYGALGVMIQTYADVRALVRAGAHAFHPPPNVDSTVLQLRPLNAPREPVGDASVYDRVVHAAFGQRRKTLRNALRSKLGMHAETALAATGIDGRRRGEELSIAEFAALSRAVHGTQSTAEAVAGRPGDHPDPE
jgi:16S rRNA (adenine1518-N6/adenine1519-N6)-dimethyltransferase